MAAQKLKEQAAAQAVELVTDGMTLGLGTGSTADCFTRVLGQRVAAGLRVRGLPTSNRTARLAAECGIPLVGFDDVTRLDLTVDGTDEFDPQLSLIKGGGGAQLREKIVASAADRFVVICDASKRVDVLGRFPLPVEVVQFGWQRTLLCLEELGCRAERRTRPDGEPFRTAQDNPVIDCNFGAIPDPEGLGRALHAIPGVVEHGLFVGLAESVIVAGPEGTETLRAAQATAH